MLNKLTESIGNWKPLGINSSPRLSRSSEKEGRWSLEVVKSYPVREACLDEGSCPERSQTCLAQTTGRDGPTSYREGAQDINVLLALSFPLFSFSLTYINHT